MGTWCARQKASTLCPSTSLGPVHPFGVRITIIGQRGRVATPLLHLLVERVLEGRAAMARGAERDVAPGHSGIWPVRIVGCHQPRDIEQCRRLSGLSRTMGLGS